MHNSGARVDRTRLALLGAWSAVLQTLFAREWLAAFGGNEAVLAVMFAAWLLLGGAGALLARSRPAGPRLLALLIALLGPAGGLSVFAARVLPRTFAGGASPGLAAGFGWAVLLLAAPCAIAGACFVWLSRRGGGAARSYLAECLGAGAAGLLLSLLVLGRVPPLVVASASSALPLLAAALGAPRPRAILLAAAALALAAGAAALPLGPWGLALQAPYLAQARELPSPSSLLVVTHTRGALGIFVDRRPVLSGLDVAAAEELAHVPLAAHPAPADVLVVGVPPAGSAQRLAEHGARTLDVVVSDPALAQVLTREPGAGLLPSHGALRVRVLAADERKFMREHAGHYDVVIIPSAEPASARESRLLSLQMLASARAALRPAGVLAVVLPGHAELAAEESRRMHSALRATLAAAYGGGAHVTVLPADSTFYLAASTAPLSGPAPARVLLRALASRAIAARHLTQVTLEDLWSPRRLGQAQRWSSLPEPASTDLHPTLLRVALDRVLGEVSEVRPAALAGLALALLLLAAVALGPRRRPVELAVLTSGASGLGAQLVLMLAVQIATGALVGEIGALLAGFMLGGALGAALAERLRADPRRLTLVCDLGQGAVVAALALALPDLIAAGSSARLGVFAGTLACGILPGAQFAAAARCLPGRPEAVAGTLWAADLLGAAIAALVTLTVLVPALGLAGALWSAAGLKAASAALLVQSPRTQAVTSTAPRHRLRALLPIALVAFVLLAIGSSTNAWLYGLSFLRPYRIAAVGSLLLLLLAAFEPRRLHELASRLAGHTERLRRAFGLGGARLLYFVLLLPVAAFPLGRCYFTLPFVFCHVCPRPCVFGVARPYVIPVALIANLNDHRFCERVCPLGSAQAACDGSSSSRARPLPRAAVLRVLALAFVVVAYFAARAGHDEGVQGTGLYAHFFQNTYAPWTFTLLAAALLLALSSFVRRPFCDALCPIGTVATALTSADKLVRRRRPPQPEGASP